MNSDRLWLVIILSWVWHCPMLGLQNYEMFIDHGISGAKESRPALNEMMTRVEKAECSQVIVFSFSRFARSVSHLLKALQKFKEKNIRFVSTTEQLDTNSPMGLALFTILGALAQMEREIIRNRVIAGLQNAKAKGKRIGRERKRNDALIHSLVEAGLSFREVSRIAKCSHGSVSARLAALSSERKKAIQKERDERKFTKKKFMGNPSPVVFSAGPIVPDEASSSVQKGV